jgi:HEAT repeat protein
MSQNEKNLEAALENWRKGATSDEDLRSLALDLGAYKYTPGIPALVELLDHKDEMVRYNAAGSLATDFKDTLATGRLLTMLASDPDEHCKSMAASSLATLSRDTKDAVVLAALAKASLEDPNEYVRDSAYEALLIVNGVSREEHLSFFRNPPHVDPDRVKSILEEVSG